MFPVNNSYTGILSNAASPNPTFSGNLPDPNVNSLGGNTAAYQSVSGAVRVVGGGHRKRKTRRGRRASGRRRGSRKCRFCGKKL
jgi:hypothetical protein